MSFSELVAIIVCLFVGYWVVSKFMSKPAGGAASADRSKENRDTHKNHGGDSTYRERTASGSDNSGGAQAEEHSETTYEWHEVLGVPPTATTDEIRRAYRQRMSEYHPDKVAKFGKELREVAERKSKEINIAYDFVMLQRAV